MILLLISSSYFYLFRPIISRGEDPPLHRTSSLPFPPFLLHAFAPCPIPTPFFFILSLNFVSVYPPRSDPLSTCLPSALFGLIYLCPLHPSSIVLVSHTPSKPCVHLMHHLLHLSPHQPENLKLTCSFSSSSYLITPGPFIAGCSPFCPWSATYWLTLLLNIDRSEVPPYGSSLIDRF